MKKKFVNKVEDFELSAADASGKYQELDNAISFTLPDIEPATEEISGYAGLAGTIELPDWSNAGAPEVSLKFSRIPENGKLILNPSGVKAKASWAESLVDESGNVTYEAYSVYAEGKPKNIPGGDKQKGNKPEVEIKIACSKYTLKKGDITIFNYDPMNGKVEIYGVNYAAGAKNALTQN